MTAPPDLGDLARIAVLRANGMGDYLVSEPALAALRAAAPQAHITLLAGTWGASALHDRPAPVDDVVLVPPIDGVRAGEYEPTARDAFIDAMRARRFDLALQMHGGGRNSNPVILAIGAAFTAGLCASDAPALDLSIDYQYWQHETFRYLEVVAALGAPAVRLHPHFAVTESDRLAGATALRRAGVDEGTVAVLHPGATDPRRRWPVASFVEVADALTATGVQVVVVGEERALVAEVAHRASATPLELGLPALVGVLESASVLVGNDSGPRHLAEAVGTPTVAVYWCGNVLNAGPTRRHGHRVHIAWTTHCPACGLPAVEEPFPRRCADNESWVTDVPVGVVVTSAVEVMRVP